MSRLEWVIVLVALAGACADPPVTAGRSSPIGPTATVPVSPPVSPPTGPTPGPQGPTYLPGIGTRLDPGVTVTGVVGRNAGECFPNWDSTGRCGVFDLTALRAGILRVRVKRLDADLSLDVDSIDLFVVAPDGTWEVSYAGLNVEETTIPVQEGEVYGVIVFAYTAGDLRFELRADIGSE